MYLKLQEWDKNPVQHALNLAAKYRDGSTLEQKSWVIDQMVRALTECPIVVREITTGRNEALEVEQLGESSQYLHFVARNPDWDKGIPE
jgi:hypothetical protein